MKIVKLTYDILVGLNTTVWGGVAGAEKVGKIVKTGLSGADVVIGTSHTIEDIACKDYVCATFDLVGSISSAVGLVLGNIPATKHLTSVSGSVTVTCRTVRYYCKNYGTVWGCTAAIASGIKGGIQETAKFTIPKSK